jgi:hypothetical protein
MLKVKSENGCNDSLKIKNVFLKSDNFIKFNTAFIPNTTAKKGGAYIQGISDNELFYPVYNGVRKYYLRIFNREGILVFETKDISVAWDGYYRDKPVEEGSYIWEATGDYVDGQSFNIRGDVTVLIKQ